MRRIKLAIVRHMCCGHSSHHHHPSLCCGRTILLGTLSTAIEKDGLVKTIESGLDSLSLIPLGLFLLLSSEPGVI